MCILCSEQLALHVADLAASMSTLSPDSCWANFIGAQASPGSFPRPQDFGAKNAQSQAKLRSEARAVPRLQRQVVGGPRGPEDLTMDLGGTFPIEWDVSGFCYMGVDPYSLRPPVLTMGSFSPLSGTYHFFSELPNPTEVSELAKHTVPLVENSLLGFDLGFPLPAFQEML